MEWRNLAAVAYLSPLLWACFMYYHLKTGPRDNASHGQAENGEKCDFVQKSAPRPCLQQPLVKLQNSTHTLRRVIECL